MFVREMRTQMVEDEHVKVNVLPDRQFFELIYDLIHQSDCCTACSHVHCSVWSKSERKTITVES